MWSMDKTFPVPPDQWTLGDGFPSASQVRWKGEPKATAMEDANSRILGISGKEYVVYEDMHNHVNLLTLWIWRHTQLC